MSRLAGWLAAVKEEAAAEFADKKAAFLRAAERGRYVEQAEASLAGFLIDEFAGASEIVQGFLVFSFFCANQAQPLVEFGVVAAGLHTEAERFSHGGLRVYNIAKMSLANAQVGAVSSVRPAPATDNLIVILNWLGYGPPAFVRPPV
jgi:hypothetical protein